MFAEAFAVIPSSANCLPARLSRGAAGADDCPRKPPSACPLTVHPPAGSDACQLYLAFRLLLAGIDVQQDGVRRGQDGRSHLPPKVAQLRNPRLDRPRTRGGGAGTAPPLARCTTMRHKSRGAQMGRAHTWHVDISCASCVDKRPGHEQCCLLVSRHVCASFRCPLIHRFAEPCAEYRAP
eukprot:5438244-Prymnesium_polylepis.1